MYFIIPPGRTEEYHVHHFRIAGSVQIMAVMVSGPAARPAVNRCKLMRREYTYKGWNTLTAVVHKSPVLDPNRRH